MIEVAWAYKDRRWRLRHVGVSTPSDSNPNRWEGSIYDLVNDCGVEVAAVWEESPGKWLAECDGLTVEGGDPRAAAELLIDAAKERPA